MGEAPGAKPTSRGSLEWKERRLPDTFRQHERLNLRSGSGDWDVMLLGQHRGLPTRGLPTRGLPTRGLPTRLLDWTSSPLVALFFACEDYDAHDRDGVVWCVKRLKTNEALGPEIQRVLESTRTGLFSLEALSDGYARLEEFDALPTDSLLFFEPPSVSPRIVAQYAFFDPREADGHERFR